MQTKCALQLTDVVFRYLEKGKRNILDHVNLDIREGTVTVIMGSSGCGKSTLAAVAAGLYPENGGILERGDIEVFGRNLKDMNQQQRAADMTVMFQNPDLQFCMDTMRGEMQFCLENLCVPAEEMEQKITEAAGMLKVTELLDRKLTTLSGGEKQKATLACLYVMGSRCIILDECFANIDPDAASELMGLIQKMKELGRTIIAIDHQVGLWIDHADELIILGPGGVPAARGINKSNLEEHYPLFEQYGLFYPKLRKRVARGYEGCEPALTFKNVTIRRASTEKKRRFHKAPVGTVLLENMNAEFPQGRMTAVLGPSGTGKTTTFLSVLGQHPYEGKIYLDGQEISTIKKQDLYRKIGIVFQNPANQFITQNVKEEVMASQKVWDKKLTEEDAEKRAMEQLEKYGLSRFHRYSPYMLSQGQQRRLAVLSVLSGGQKLLLLDEPTYGQDYRSAMSIMTQLRERMEKDGLTVIFITHDHVLAETYADKIYRIDGTHLSEMTEFSAVYMEGEDK